MKPASRRPQVVGFGVFELDLHTGELLRRGVKVPLQEQPVRLLGLLLEHAGELVSREEIGTALWPEDAYGDLDHRLNNAVNKIRIALGDSAENPRFLETIKGRGYRFTAPVRQVAGIAQKQTSSIRPLLSSRARRRAAGGLILAGVLIPALWLSLRAPSQSSPDRIMLAVLPFKNIGPGTTEDYLADGLTEEVILQLGRLSSSQLGVIARTSVMPYKTSDQGIRGIGEELGVDYLLEGSVRQESDRLRIAIQLVGVDQQTPLWAESYNRTLEDIFSIQRDVAERVSASLALEVLSPVDGQPAAPTRSRAAHQAYMKARYFRDQGTEKGFNLAINYFRLAIAEDPSYAQAYAGLASCQCLLAGHGLEILPPDEAMPKARDLADKALGLDVRLAEAHAVLGMVRLKYEWDFAGAEESFLRALELNPSYAQAYVWYSLYLEAMGRGEEAVLHARTARELDPISKGAAANLAIQMLNVGRFEEASTQIVEALELDAGFWGTHWALGNLHARRGEYARAAAAFQDAVDFSRRNGVSLTSLGFTLARAGRRSEAEAVLRELQDLREKRYLSPAFIAAIYAGLGEKNEAFGWLEKAFRLRSRYLVWLKVAPEYEQLRSDPRYQELVARIGLS